MKKESERSVMILTETQLKIVKDILERNESILIISEKNDLIFSSTKELYFVKARYNGFWWDKKCKYFVNVDSKKEGIYEIDIEFPEDYEGLLNQSHLIQLSEIVDTNVPEFLVLLKKDKS